MPSTGSSVSRFLSPVISTSASEASAAVAYGDIRQVAGADDTGVFLFEQGDVFDGGWWNVEAFQEYASQFVQYYVAAGELVFRQYVAEQIRVQAACGEW